MAKSGVLQVRLSNEALSFVRGLVERGDAASEGDAVRELIELEAAEQRRFVREEVMMAYQESLDVPESAISIDEVWRNLGLASRDHAKAG